MTTKYILMKEKNVIKSRYDQNKAMLTEWDGIFLKINENTFYSCLSLCRNEKQYKMAKWIK